MSRSFTASWMPCAAPRCTSRCASKVLPARTRSKRKVRPSAAASSVICACEARICSTLAPYLVARCSARSPSRSAGACGSSSNERQVTVTWSRCSKPASAASKRRLPMWHQGQAMSDQISTCTAFLSRAGAYGRLARERVALVVEPEVARERGGAEEPQPAGRADVGERPGPRPLSVRAGGEHLDAACRVLVLEQRRAGGGEHRDALVERRVRIEDDDAD